MTAEMPVNCVHHWAIERANGSTSQGVCRRCGAARSFSNFNEALNWDRRDAYTSDAFRPSRSTTKVAEPALADEF